MRLASKKGECDAEMRKTGKTNINLELILRHEPYAVGVLDDLGVCRAWEGRRGTFYVTCNESRYLLIAEEKHRASARLQKGT